MIVEVEGTPIILSNRAVENTTNILENALPTHEEKRIGKNNLKGEADKHPEKQKLRINLLPNESVLSELENTPTIKMKETWSLIEF